MIDTLLIYLLNIGLFLVSILIIYQDFKDRAVYWWLYLLFFVILLVFSIYHNPVELVNRVINLSFLVIQYLGVILYYWIKTRKSRLILNEEFGLGDAIFLVSIALTIETTFFIYLYLGGLITSILWCIIMYLKNKELPTIPLAGILTLVFLLIQLTDYVSMDKIY